MKPRWNVLERMPAHRVKLIKLNDESQFVFLFPEDSLSDYADSIVVVHNHSELHLWYGDIQQGAIVKFTSSVALALQENVHS